MAARVETSLQEFLEAVIAPTPKQLTGAGNIRSRFVPAGNFTNGLESERRALQLFGRIGLSIQHGRVTIAAHGGIFDKILAPLQRRFRMREQSRGRQEQRNAKNAILA